VIKKVLLLIILVGMVPINGCINSLSDDQYVVIEETVIIDGKLLSGEYPKMPVVQLPLVYDINNPALDPPFSYPEINRSFKALYGLRFNVFSPEGYFYNLSSVEGIYEFPYQLESGLTITSIDKSGTLNMIFNNKSITLKPGNRWKYPGNITRIEMVNRTSYSYIASFNTTYELINRGPYKKSDLLIAINAS
jgi:hypothetical protein